MYAALKSTLLVLALVISVRGLTPPTPPAAKEKVYYRQNFDIVMRGLVYLRHAIFLAVVGCEIITLFELENAEAHGPSKTYMLLCHTPPHAASRILGFTPAFVAGITLICAGGLLRMWCYRTLGKLFTFEVAMFDDHTLVKSGPYAIVRHPAYTGVAAVVLGTLLEFFGPGSYFQVCDLMGTATVRGICLHCMVGVYSTIAVCRRTRVEDGQLKAKFGEDWEAYRRAVPYKLVPFLV